MTPDDQQPPPITDTDELGTRRKVLGLADDIADLLKDLWDRVKEYGDLGVPAREWLKLVGARMPQRFDSFIEWASPYISGAIDIGLPYVSGKLGEEMVASRVVEEARERHREDHVTGKLVTVNLSKARDTALLIADEDPPLHEDLRNLAESFLALDDDAIRMAESPSTIRMRRLIGRLFAEAPKLETPGKGADTDQAPAVEVNVILRGLMQPLSGVLSKTPEGTLKLLTPIPPDRTPGKVIMIEQFFDYADVTSVAVQRELSVSAPSSIIVSS